MSKSTCKNIGCKNKIKSRGYFCSTTCFNSYRKEHPEEYKNSGAFKKGHKSWNKGKRFTKIGDTKIEKIKLKSGERRDRRWVFTGQYQKNGQPKYMRNDKYVWILENRTIPKGYTIWHKDGRTLNDDIENLECIPYGEAQSRYAYSKRKIFNLQNKNHIKKIIEGCERGDRRIQKQLYEMMYPKMFSVALRYASDYDTAKDVMSDSFIKVFSKIKSVDVNKKNIEGWIRCIIVRTGIDYYRKNSKKDYLTDSIDYTFGEEESDYIFNKVFEEESFSEKMDGEYIVNMIQELTPAYQIVFNLIVIEGFTHKDVSNKLGISKGTSKSNLSRAKKKLQEKIIKHYQEDNENIINLENNFSNEV